MKYSIIFFVAVWSCFGLCQNLYAESKVTTYRVISGEVIVTRNCQGGDCEVITAKLSGAFRLKYDADTEWARVPSSMLRTTPNIDFQIPRNPKSARNKEKTAEFALVGDTGVSIDGIIDRRSSGGPLVEYKISAEIDGVQADTSGFYLVRPDFRQCAFPECGGYFVKRANTRLTRCYDDSLREQCYVAKIPALGVLDDEDIITNPDDDSAYLIQGKLKRAYTRQDGHHVTFKTRRGSFIYGGIYDPFYNIYLVERNDVICPPPEGEIYPYDACPRYKATILNTGDITMLAFASTFGSVDTIPRNGLFTIASGFIVDIDGQSFDGDFIFMPLNKPSDSH